LLQFTNFFHKGRQSHRRSLQPLKKNNLNFKTRHFFTFFSIFVVNFSILVRIHRSDCRVSDPDPYLDPDPHAEFRIRIDLMRIRIRIRIQHFFWLRIRIPYPGSGFRIPDLDPGFDDLKLKKIYSWKFNFYILDKKIAIYLSLGLHKGRPSYRRSLQP
jgi:hypothetical protein